MSERGGAYYYYYYYHYYYYYYYSYYYYYGAACTSVIPVLSTMTCMFSIAILILLLLLLNLVFSMFWFPHLSLLFSNPILLSLSIFYFVGHFIADGFRMRSEALEVLRGPCNIL